MTHLIASLASAVMAVACCFAQSAAADVWEYGRDGRIVTINGRVSDQTSTTAQAVSTRNAPRQSASADRARYRAMAEAVALQYAGSDGVRLAGIDALTFADVFCALIDQESRFNPRAVSPKGARGLGQLMPATAARLKVADPFDPEANLHGAARYFTRQLLRFQDVELALAAYNAGPHRIVQYDGIPPFRETRSYVARITKAAGLTKSTRGPVPPRGIRASSPPSSNRKASVWEF